MATAKYSVKCGILVQAESKSSSLEFAEAPPKILQKSTIFAEIAQLVEHNLAKVGVASPSLVFRSKC